MTITSNASYTDCESNTATLQVATLNAVATTGVEVSIPENRWGDFSFNWMKDNVEQNVFDTSISLNFYTDNGEYCATVEYANATYTSNKKNIKLSAPVPSLVTSKNVLCNGQEATLTANVIENAVYSWFKDNVLIASTTESTFIVNEPANYHVQVALAGCTSTSEVIVINPFNEDLVTIYPSSKVFITSEGSEIISATGAERYVWTDSSGLTLSTSDSFTATQEGTYYVTAYINGCEVTKAITVIVSESFVVPNIISPSQDNINDTWVLPANIINDPEVEITICDTYGKPVLKTNNYQNNWPEASSTVNKSSIYYYFINKNGKALKKGSITVVGL